MHQSSCLNGRFNRSNITSSICCTSSLGRCFKHWFLILSWQESDDFLTREWKVKRESMVDQVDRWVTVFYVVQTKLNLHSTIYNIWMTSLKVAFFFTNQDSSKIVFNVYSAIMWPFINHFKSSFITPEPWGWTAKWFFHGFFFLKCISNL